MALVPAHELKVISKIKEGNKVKYVCKDVSSSHESVFSKEELIQSIQNGIVINARIQNYKGQLIIRIKEDDETNIQKQPRKNKNQQEKASTKQKKIYAIDLFKDIMKNFGIKQEELALSVGFDNYDLEEEITYSGTVYIDKLSYQMASDIKKIADMENNQILMNYRSKYIERNNI